MAYKSFFLPLERDDEGNLSLTTPGFVEALKGAFTAPRRAWEGEFTDDPSQAIKEALGTSGFVGTGAFASRATAPKGSIGMFVGERGASLPEKEKLGLAKEMMRKGFTDKQIHDKTGWRQGPEGAWRTEISDVNAKLKLQDAFTFKGKLGDLLDHPELFKRYPDLKDLELNMEKDFDIFPQGQYIPPYKDQLEKISVSTNMMPRRDTSVLLHEIMHAIQTREKFAPGGSPSQMPFNKAFQSRNLAASEASAFTTVLKKGEYQKLLEKYGMWSPDLEDQIKAGYKFNEFGHIASTIADEALKSGDNLAYKKATNYITALKKSNPVPAKVYRDAKELWYRNLAGEIEARLVQSRRGLRQEELGYFYPEDKQYPWNESIVKGKK